MSKRNALLEWLDQTKKLTKSKDYIFLDLVDRIFDVLWLIDPKILSQHAELLNDVCSRYHKPNPLDVLKDRKAREAFLAGYNTSALNVPKNCVSNKKCDSFRRLKCSMTKFVKGTLVQAEVAQKDILWQWFEVIDFMFERPELINPKAIDEYAEERIEFVCRTYRKNNPLKSSIRKRFGLFYKDENDRWKPERRKRF